MPPEDCEKNVDKPVESPTKSDVLKPDEAKSVQEGASDMAGDRKRFLMSSLGRAMSASTEVLKDMVMSIYDGGKKVVGLGTGERAKIELPKDAPKGSNGSSDVPTGMLDPGDISKGMKQLAEIGGLKPLDLATGMMDPGDIAKAVKGLADAGLKGQDLPTGLLDPGDISKVMKAKDILDPAGAMKEAPTKPGDTKGDDHQATKPEAKAPTGDQAGDDKIAKAKPTDEGVQPQRKPEEYPESQKTVDAKALKEIQENKDVKSVHKELDNELAKLPQDQQERFNKNREAFEKRAASETPPLKPEEVAKTEAAALKLLKAGDGKIDQTERRATAEQIMLHAAYPSSIDQGGHNTCNVAAMENRMFAKNPSAAAEMISQVALEGKYTVKGPPEKTVEVPADSLKPHPKDGEESANPPKDNQRGLASQIFQVAAVNVSLETHGVDVGTKHYNPGEVQYKQGDPQPGTPPTTGEVLVDKKTGEPIKDASGRPIEEPHLNDDQQVDLYKEIAKTEDGKMLVNEGMLVGKGDKATTFKSEEDFKKQLEKAAGPPSQFPIVLKVNSGQEPFFSDSGGGSAGGSGGAHVVTITGYDKQTGEAKIDNQWGKGGDHSVNVHDLYVATKDPKDAVVDLKKECTENAKNGRVDYKKELELLRLEKGTGELTPEQYQKSLAALSKETIKDAWDNKGKQLDKETCTELYRQLKDSPASKDIPADVMDVIKRGASPYYKGGDLSKDNQGQEIKLPKDFGGKADLAKDADEVYKSLNWWNQEDRLRQALEGKTPSQIQEMDRVFKEKHGQSMEQYIKADTGGEKGQDAENVRKALEALHPEQAVASAKGSGDKVAKAAAGDAAAAAPPESHAKPGDAPSQPSDKSADKSAEGAVGDRGRDAGKGPTTKPEVTTDDQGRISQFKLPDGQKYDIKYGDDGKPKAVTLQLEGGRPITFEKNAKGEFINPDNPKQGLKDVVMGDDGKITIKDGQSIVELGKKGSFLEKDFLGQQKVKSEIKPDGEVHKFDHDKGTETITKPGSHVSEVKDINGGATKGYEVKDNHNHVTKIEQNSDGTVSVKHGDKTETYKEIKSDGKGGVELSGRMDDAKGGIHKPDSSTVHISADGTEIRKSDGKNVSEITNADGETTTFKKGPAGVEATVTDGQGKVVEKGTKVTEGPNDDGTYQVARGKDNVVERKADGTERLLDKSGKPVETEGDKLLAKYKNLTPEQTEQLKRDLADIDKLPEAQRKKVYESLDKIARNDEHPGDKVKLTGEQSRELVCSLAHQIAHPESIKQGCHESCAAANMEELMARNHPDRYADMVSQLATQGEYKFPPPSDKTVKAETHGEKLDPKSDSFGQRSYSSELFQDAAIQLAVQPKDYKSYPPGSPELVPRPPGVNASNDNGERIIANPPPNGTKETRDGQTILKEPVPGTNPPENREWLMRPDGSAIRGFQGLDSEKQLNAYKTLFPEEKYGEYKPVNSPKDLEAALKANGGPPMKVAIGLGNENFSGMSSGTAGTDAGNHAVVVTQIKDGKVYYENTAGGKDHSYPHGEGVPIQEFVDAMKKGDKGAFVKGYEGKGGSSKGKEGSSGASEAPEGSSGAEGSAAKAKGAGILPEAKAPDAAPTPKGGDYIPPVPPGSEGAKWYEMPRTKEAPGDKFDPLKPQILEAPREVVEHPIDTAKKIWEKLTGEEKSGTSSGNVRQEAPQGNIRQEAPQGKSPSPDSKGTEATPPSAKGDQGSKWWEMPTAKGENDPFESLKPRVLEGPSRALENPSETAREIWNKITGDKPPDKVQRNADLNTEREHLKKAESAIRDPAERKQLEADMAAFEKRAREAHPPVPPEEVARTYKEVSRLLEAKGDTPTNAADRVKLAENVMHQAAAPTSIDQGQHSTCNVTTVEARTYTQNPSAAAKMVADVATTGSFTTADGIKVKVPENNIKPDKEAQRHADGDRSYASQLFQITAVNIKCATDNAKSDPPGKTHYEQSGPKPNEKNPTPPSGGERVVDNSTNPPKTEKFKGLYAKDLPDIERQITGKSTDGTVIQHEKTGSWFDGTEKVGSTEDLKDQLAKAKAEGKMPVIVQVYTNHEPFRTDSGHGKAGGSGGEKGGCHVVTVTDYDPKTGKCSVDNQWGSQKDHVGKDAIPADQLFKAMQKPEGKAATSKESGAPAETTREAGREASGEAPRETPREAAKGAEQAAAGDRSRDTGIGTREKPEVKTDANGRVTEYKLPDGGTYQVKYDEKGEASSITMPVGNKPVTFEKVNGNWTCPDDPSKTIGYVDIGKDGTVKIAWGEVDKDKKTGENYKVTLGPDGSYKKSLQSESRTFSEIKPNGEVHNYRYESNDPRDKGTDVVTKPGSHVSEVRDGKTGDLKGYEARDNGDHVTKIDKNDDGTYSVKRGDKTETYQKWQPDGKGGVELSGRMDDGKGGVHKPDSSTVHIGADGTEIRKSDGRHVSEITNADGEKSTFNNGKVTVTDGQGKVVEQGAKVIDGPKDDGTYKVERGKDQVVERKADGTEQVLDKKTGQPVDTEGDKILNKYKNLTPEQRDQLKKDLADIDKLPEAQRKKVYESLDKIANNDIHTGDKIRLTGQQSRELVCSLAHQIAHPESIQQGSHNSCAAASMEETLARSHPDRYADMVSKLATQGEYKCPPPSDKTVTAENHDGKLDPKSDAYGQRSYTSELFQDAANQLAVQPKTYRSFPLDSPDIQPRPSGVDPSKDTGERIIDPKNPKAPPEEFKGLSPEDQIKAYKELVPEEKYGERPIKSPKDLEKALKDNGGPPLRVGIVAGHGETFTGMTAEGAHAVVITQIKDGKVYFENTAGGKDHSYPRGEGVAIQEFVDSMKKNDSSALVKGADSQTGGSKAKQGIPDTNLDKQERKSSADTKGEDRAAASSEADSALIARPGIKLAVENLLGQQDRVKQREQLDKEIEKKFEGKPEELAKFKKDMEAFEARANGTPPLSNKEIAETYKQVGRILNAPDNPDIPLNAEDRLRIASQVMHHAAEPTSINQGLDPTCNVATVESRTYARDPSKAAEMVADVATTGKFRTKDQVDENGKVIPGKEVKVDPGSLKQDPEAISKASDAAGQGVRDQASKIFQVAAVNAVWAEHPLTVGGKTYPPGTVEFRQTDPKTGEYQRGCLYDKTKNPPEMIKDGKGEGIAEPRIDMDHMTDLARSITGRNETDVAIEHAEKGNAQKTVKIESQEDLRKQLTIMKESGQLPVIIRVHENNSPFWGDSGWKSGKTASEKGSDDHVVTITDFDPKTGMVSVDNQRGEGKDHIGGSAISIGDMYGATLPPGDPRLIEQLEKDVQWNREKGTIDTFKELELLRQKHEGKQLSDAEYQKQVDKTMAEAQQRWKQQDAAGQLNPTEKQHAEEQYKKIQENLTKREQEKAKRMAMRTQY